MKLLHPSSFVVAALLSASLSGGPASAQIGQADGTPAAAAPAPAPAPASAPKKAKKKAAPAKASKAKKKAEPVESKYKSHALSESSEHTYRFNEKGEPLGAKKKVSTPAKKDSSEPSADKPACSAEEPCTNKTGSEPEAL